MMGDTHEKQDWMKLLLSPHLILLFSLTDSLWHSVPDFEMIRED